MDYTPPPALRDALDQAARKKAALSVRVLLLSGFLSGALLAFATAFAFWVSNALPEARASLIAGLVFPVGFAMIVLLGTDIGLADWLWWNQVPVTLGNILGGAVFTGLLLHYAQPGAPAAS